METKQTDRTTFTAAAAAKAKLAARQDDPVACLRAPGVGSTIQRLRKKEAIFYQAMPADCVFYLLQGRVKLTVISSEGKQATIALMRAGDFLGEECIAGNHLRTSTAIAISECTVLRTGRRAMIDVLRRDQAFFKSFLSFMVSRNVRMQETLMDRLFHTGEKRLARILLLLADFDSAGQSEIIIPKVSQEALAEIVGTTRSRVSIFMNSFRKEGFIDYDADYSGDLLIRCSLMQVLSRS
ncbi:MAG TPA: Crp/Fnr family transcriptional regulator [Candidatus Angelobacter sp.]|jgi:CRP-like cAMP-binding protein